MRQFYNIIRPCNFLSTRLLCVILLAITFSFLRNAIRMFIYIYAVSQLGGGERGRLRVIGRDVSYAWRMSRSSQILTHIGRSASAPYPRRATPKRPIHFSVRRRLDLARDIICSGLDLFKKAMSPPPHSRTARTKSSE